LIGFFANACSFILITYGETYIPSSLAAIMNSTTPLFTAFIAHFFVAGDRLKLHKIFGILLGMMGILVIFLPSFDTLQSEDFFGCFLVLGGSLSYAISFVLSKKRAANFPPIVFRAGQLLAGSLFLIPFGMNDLSHMKPLCLSASLSLIFLSLIGTALAFVLYHKLITRTNPTFVSFPLFCSLRLEFYLGTFS
jgi:drug/metabolite transporter (DMT)-like permease